MKNFLAPVILGLCLSGVLADLPYHDFEGSDVYIDVPVTREHTYKPHYPTGTGTAGGHHHHHHPSPTDADSPEPTQYHQYDVRDAPDYHHHPHPTAYPTGGYPPHPGNSHHHHPPGGSPPYPTDVEPHLRRFGKDLYTMTTVTRTRGPSGGFPPYGTGTGSPYPYPRKI